MMKKRVSERYQAAWKRERDVGVKGKVSKSQKRMFAMCPETQDPIPTHHDSVGMGS